MFGPMPAGASDLSVDELQQMMTKHGIGSCCTLSTVGLLLDHNAGNGATRAACSENSALIPVATINPQSYFGQDGAFLKFKADGYRLVRFFPGPQKWVTNYAPLTVLAKRLEVEGLPIMVDISQPGMASSLVDSLVSHPSSLILAGVDHRTASEAVALMRAHARVYIETSQLNAVGAIKTIIDAVGADRVLYGSGAPLRPMASGLNVIKFAGLSDDQLAKVLGGNARQLLEI